MKLWLIMNFGKCRGVFESRLCAEVGRIWKCRVENAYNSVKWSVMGNSGEGSSDTETRGLVLEINKDHIGD
jgi:hypothetical protein